MLDSQSVRAAAGVPKATTGLEVAKKTPGRRRGLAVGVIGLIIAVVVVAASVHDNAIDAALLNKVAATGSVRTALVDQGFKNAVVEHGAKLGISVQIVARNPAGGGFVPEPIRWRVEQTNGLNMMERRLARDYEHALSCSQSRIYWALPASCGDRARRCTVPSGPYQLPSIEPGRAKAARREHHVTAEAHFALVIMRRPTRARGHGPTGGRQRGLRGWRPGGRLHCFRV